MINKLLLYFFKISASLPVVFKGGILTRVLIRVFESRKYKISGYVKVISNYGISDKLKVELPLAKSSPLILFGTPKNYKGEYFTLQLSQMLFNSADCFLDIGANWGYYSYFMSCSVKHQKSIYSFEPNIFLCDILRTNIINNKMKNIQTSDLAIGDTTGYIQFYINRADDLTSSIIEPIQSNKFTAISVPCTSLENWLSINNDLDNLLIKVDVENAEWNFIHGAEKVMHKIKYLIMEVLGPARQSGFINYMISNLGLNAYYINQNKIEHVKSDDMRYTPVEYNWLFCKDEPIALRKLLDIRIFQVIG